MTAQRLDRTLICYRIGGPAGAYPIFDATGSTLAPGRWNTPGNPVIYSAEHYSTAILEKLVHGSGRLPPNRHYIEFTIPRGLSCEVFSQPALPGWDSMPAAGKQAVRRDMVQGTPQRCPHRAKRGGPARPQRPHQSGSGLPYLLLRRRRRPGPLARFEPLGAILSEVILEPGRWAGETSHVLARMILAKTMTCNFSQESFKKCVYNTI